MRKIQLQQQQGPLVYANMLKEISNELGVLIEFITPERFVSDYHELEGYEYEKGDLLNYDIVLDKLMSKNITHVIYSVIGFSFLRMFFPNSTFFSHSFPDESLEGSSMMTPFMQMVSKAIVQTEYLKDKICNFGTSDVHVIPIGFDEHLSQKHYDESQIVNNRVLWIGRDESFRQPEVVIDFAQKNPDVDVHMVFGGERYQESIKRFDIPSNLTLHFALSRPEIFQLMNTCKVYWCSSTYDTFGIPIAEALSMGKFVIKPEHPCYNHFNSQHIYAGNKENWGDLVNMALHFEHNVSNENRRYAYDHFSRTKMKKGYLEFFDKWL